jgi:hypothetical protein
MKTFTMSGTNAILPIEWLQAAGAPGHVRQGDMLMTALTKADVPALLTDRGLGQRVADSMARYLKMSRGLSTGWQMLVDAGIVDLDEVAVYAAYNMVRDSVVVRIDLDGVITPVARFGYDSRREAPLYVEAI